jgi:hypothetical protein
MSTTAKFYLAGAVALVAVVVMLQKKSLVTAAVAGAVGVANDAAGGLVMGVGSVFGVPATDADKCTAAKASGSLWDQSLYCTAPQFASSAWQTASTAAGSAIQTASTAAGNAIQSVGEVIGIPRTNETECQKALREGRTWDASFACPAGTWLSSTFGL